MVDGLKNILLLGAVVCFFFVVFYGRILHL
jgi:hypothetical protein